MKVKILITFLALVFNASVNVFGEDLPKELLQPGVGLELIDGTKHELLNKVAIEEATYFIVYQTPEFGPSELVLIKQQSGGKPQFVRGGTWADFTRAAIKSSDSHEQTIPEQAKYATASALALREINSRSIASLHSADESGKAMARLAERVKEEDKNGQLDKYLRQAYQDQGLMH
jgi:hypothetical protein